MRHQLAKLLMSSIGLSLMVNACDSGRSKIRAPGRDISVRGTSGADAIGETPSDPALAQTQAELDAAKKQLADLQAAQANSGKDPAEIAKLQEQVDQANQRIAAAEAELKKKDQEAQAAQAAQEKAKRDALGFSLQYKHSSKCLDIDGASMVDGARIIQMPCNETNIQHFRLVAKASGSWIQNVATGRCMATLAAGTDNSTQVVQATCVENGSMLFTLQPDGNGYVFLKNAGSNRCVDIEAISTADRAGAQIYDCLNGDAQRVKLIAAPAS